MVVVLFKFCIGGMMVTFKHNIQMTEYEGW